MPSAGDPKLFRIAGGNFHVTYMARADLEEVGRHLSDMPAGAISVAELARRLGSSVSTARRRLDAWAAAHHVSLCSVSAREGARGPTTARWYVARTAPAPSPPRPPAPAPPPPDDPTRTLPAAVLGALAPDERQALRLLMTSGSARTSELAAQLGRSGDRTEGLLRTLRRKLHRLGTPLIDNETLPDGEALFRFSRPKAP